MSLESYAEKFTRIKVNTSSRGGGEDGSGPRASPHKICMLLAVLDLARAGGLEENRILYEPPLLERFRRFFDAVRAPGDHPKAYLPFFHLTGELRGGEPSFWHLEAVPGQESAVAAMRTVRSHGEIINNIACARLDPELYALLQDPANIDALTDALGRYWFDRGLEDLGVVVQRSAEVSRYERRLRIPLPIAAAEPTPPEYIRDPAFRRIVTQAYDYRCAATGVRILLPSGEAMVEAAHIHPFAEAGDDDPRNGIALSPDMHWAMDRHLIAPGPDLRWHVSARLDPRIPDLRTLCELEGRELLPPREPRFYPKKEALEWRLAQLWEER